MPIHDWARVPSGIFHHFHQSWSIEIARRLNRGLLPKGVSALVEQRIRVKEGDVLTHSTTKEIYAGRANRISVKHHLVRILAVIEIVSPGNKDSRSALRDFVDKILDFLRQGVHILVVDLFPPTSRDPLGLHKIIWDEFLEEPFVFPEGMDRILASYETGGGKTAFVEPVAVGDDLPDMPLFLAEGLHILVPLESTYRAAWDASPEEMRLAVETGVMPDPDAE